MYLAQKIKFIDADEHLDQLRISVNHLNPLDFTEMLKMDQFLQINQKNSTFLPFNNYYHLYFLPHIEKNVAGEFYYCPLILTERIIFWFFIDKKMAIFDDLQQNTIEFI